jgi:hypothetical protein
MMASVRATRPDTATEVREFLARHREAISFSIEAFGSKRRGLVSAPVMAPVARASYAHDRERLKRFGLVVSTGMGDEVLDHGALLLRAWLVDTSRGVARITTAPHAGRGSQGIALVRYAKTSRALAAFVNGELINRLFAATDELFMLPEELTRRGANG